MSKALMLALLATCVFAQAPKFPKPSFFHPGCTITSVFEQDCGSLITFLNDEYGLFRPGPNGFYFYSQSTTMDNAGNTYLLGNVTNPGSWYNFDTLVAFGQGENLCTVAAQSRSRFMSYFDGYANYCNNFLLFRGFNSLQTTISDCKWQPKDPSTCTAKS